MEIDPTRSARTRETGKPGPARAGLPESPGFRGPGDPPDQGSGRRPGHQAGPEGSPISMPASSCCTLLYLVQSPSSNVPRRRAEPGPTRQTTVVEPGAGGLYAGGLFP